MGNLCLRMCCAVCCRRKGLINAKDLELNSWKVFQHTHTQSGDKIGHTAVDNDIINALRIE